MTANTEHPVEPQRADNQSLTLELTTPIDDRRPVFVVGNFNHWTTDEPRFQMRRVARDKFVFTFPNDVQLPQRLEYKYIRGGWENKELDAFGNTTENRVVESPQGLLNDFVPLWVNYGLTFNPAFLPKIRIVDTAFFSPEMKKSRRVVALLPHDYDRQKAKRYPVLYLQDGQNLFDDHAPFGNWAIDKKLAVLAERGMGDIIVIAVDHGGAERINEFLPPDAQRRLGRSEARRYVNFIAKTVKNRIDSTFRTLPDRLHTGVGGSSMGGLVTIYAGLMFPKTYGRLMIFSPSLWTIRNVQFENIRFSEPISTKIYTYAGGKEGSNMVPNVHRLGKSIENQGFDASTIQFKAAIDPQGLHNERRWGEEFPKAVEWLFFTA